ncbi:MAG: protein TolR [Gammaproteobacteria bacterium]|nr:protein TolR [Gammaproteobacteria bacterium]
MAKRKHRKLVSELNVVPYIDVMLVLLVIFMVTAPMITASVSVDLPQSKALPSPPKDQPPILVQVDSAGVVSLKLGDLTVGVVSDEELVTSVKTHLADPKNAGTAVYVGGDKAVAYEKVIKALGVLAEAGVANVGLMSQSEQ